VLLLLLPLRLPVDDDRFKAQRCWSQALSLEGKGVT